MTSLLAIAVIPLFLAVFSLLNPLPKLTRVVCPALLWVELAALIWDFFPILTGAQAEIGLAEIFRIDRLSACFVLLTTTVVASCLTQADCYFDREVEEKPVDSLHFKIFYASVCLFLLAMISVFICDNFGYMWISIEATTLFSAPLVYFDRNKYAIEATWKYLIICSVGIAFALLGTTFIFASSQHGAIPHGSLSISELIKHHAELNFPLLRLGFIFCLLGYGTKAGIYPLHNWLPDAHSEAPAPASAMLSGSLLNCALFGVWRTSQLFSPKNSIVMCEMMIWMGVITTLAAAFFLIKQISFKRMWAYSSIENVGLMLVAIGIGSPGLFFLQAVNHSCAKVSLFLLSGNIIQASGTKKLNKIHGVIETTPLWGVLLVLATLAVAGAPPFGSFTSEMLILLASMKAMSWYAAGLLIVAISVSFIAICANVGAVVFGPALSK
ncbi:MAG: hypothetical protein K2X81_09100, partial [Candidatus Obscuribacterales bacterium]|nr:hypothetical protein [Candidatus Obscuribacterales bacterium]